MEGMAADGVFDRRPGTADPLTLTDADRNIPGAATAARALQAARDGAWGDLDGMAGLGFTTRRQHLRAVS